MAENNMERRSSRPVFLDLLRIRLPVTGIVSILHRITGLALLACTPLLVWLLDYSLRDQGSFSQIIHWFDQMPAKLLLAVGTWVLAHHMFAGLRILLLDVDIGTTRCSARRSAWLVHVVAAMIGLGVLVVLS